MAQRKARFNHAAPLCPNEQLYDESCPAADAARLKIGQFVLRYWIARAAYLKEGSLGELETPLAWATKLMREGRFTVDGITIDQYETPIVTGDGKAQGFYDALFAGGVLDDMSAADLAKTRTWVQHNKGRRLGHVRQGGVNRGGV